MSDLAVYHNVSELLKHFEYLSKTSDNLNANTLATTLLKYRTPNVSVPVQGLATVTALAASLQNNEDIIQKYDQIRMKNRRELDPTVSLIAQIVALTDKKSSSVRHLLKKNAEYKIRYQMEQVNVKTETEDSSEPVSDKHESKEKQYSKNSGPCLTFVENCSLSWDFESLGKHDNIGCIGELPLNVQESKLIDDLLFCLGGINGDYVYSTPELDSMGMRQFIVDESSDPSLQELVKRVLPVCSYYSTVVRFIEEHSQYSHGLVNHALAAAMRHLLKDFYILVAQLEHQFSKCALSLQKMWFYLQPTKKMMEMLSYVCESVTQGNCHGGSVLSVLHKIVTTQTGDSKMQDLLIYLLKASCTPYFEILEKWIYNGKILDPYYEFFVFDNQTDKQKECSFIGDEYWEKKYVISREKIPVFLEKVSDNILRTGKYLNVIQQCGHDISCPNAEKMAYSIEERQYIEQTEKAYSYASQVLLNMLMEDSDLIGRLRSLKHYFLMDQGDLIIQFMDMAEEELNKNVEEIIPTRLEFLLELALRTSVVNSDKYKDDVKINIVPYNLHTEMFKILVEGFNEVKDKSIPGIEALVFKYNVKWPLSLVINRQALACYGMLFRHLFYCKYVERLLGNVWSMNKVAKSYSLDSSRGYASAFALRQQMLSFIQALEYYMNFEILEPSWHNFISKIQEVTNVDDLLTIHNKFLDGCLKDCMLTLPDLLSNLVKLLKLCVSFANFMKKTHHGAVEAELSLIGTTIAGAQSSAPSSLITRETEECTEVPLSFREKISEFQADFYSLLFELLKLITTHDKEHYSDKLVNMWYRLDFNGFYVNELQSQSMCA